jgi:hypothetical protein
MPRVTSTSEGQEIITFMQAVRKLVAERIKNGGNGKHNGNGHDPHKSNGHEGNGRKHAETATTVPVSDSEQKKEGSEQVQRKGILKNLSSRTRRVIGAALGLVVVAGVGSYFMPEKEQPVVKRLAEKPKQPPPNPVPEKVLEALGSPAASPSVGVPGEPPKPEQNEQVVAAVAPAQTKVVPIKPEPKQVVERPVEPPVAVAAVPQAPEKQPVEVASLPVRKDVLKDDGSREQGQQMPSSPVSSPNPEKRTSKPEAPQVQVDLTKATTQIGGLTLLAEATRLPSAQQLDVLSEVLDEAVKRKDLVVALKAFERMLVAQMPDVDLQRRAKELIDILRGFRSARSEVRAMIAEGSIPLLVYAGTVEGMETGVVSICKRIGQSTPGFRGQMAGVENQVKLWQRTNRVTKGGTEQGNDQMQTASQSTLNVCAQLEQKHGCSDLLSVLHRIDPVSWQKKHVRSGKAERIIERGESSSQSILLKADAASYIFYPIEKIVPFNSYKLRSAFSRQTGDGPIFFELPVGENRMISFCLNAGGKWGGFADIDGTAPQDEDNPTRISKCTLMNGRKYSVDISVWTGATDQQGNQAVELIADVYSEDDSGKMPLFHTMFAGSSKSLAPRRIFLSQADQNNTGRGFGVVTHGGIQAKIYDLSVSVSR